MTATDCPELEFINREVIQNPDRPRNGTYLHLSEAQEGSQFLPQPNIKEMMIW